MAKHLEKFTTPFLRSRIPFLLLEVITDGRGDMVDLVFRFANDAAGKLLNLPTTELRGLRFTRRFPAQQLEALRPLQAVAFSGSTASFPYTTVLGEQVTVTCYQPMYGMAACILDTGMDSGRESGELLADHLPSAVAVLELSRAGVRCLSFNQRLCTLTGRSRKELMDRFSEDLSLLTEPEDWPDLLQALLDAVHGGPSVAHEFRLRRREGDPLWVDLRAELLHTREGVSTFYAVLLDIDQRRRAQAGLRETLSQLKAAQGQLTDLFDSLPGGYCLLRQTAEGTLIPLRISRGLAELLGYSTAELTRRTAADPLWRVFPGDREELAAASVQSRALGLPLKHICRLRPKGGGTVWVSLEAVRRPGADGACLLYAACFDVTGTKDLEAQLHFRTQLCDLLLDRSPVLLLDYAPASGTAHIDSPDSTGRRTTHTVEDYLSALGETPCVHPEDRKRLAAAVKRAAARPAVETVEYRGDYDGRGWRWYRLSWARQIDGQGNVTRLLGKAEDITAQKAAAQHFQQLRSHQKKPPPGVLASAMLDLTEDRILDARGGSRHLSRVLFGNTADACLRHLRDNVPGEAQRQQFDALFRRDTLLEAFHRGQTRLCLEHRFARDKTRILWAETALQLAEDPDSGHVTAFCTVRDTDAAHQQDRVLELLAREYGFVLTVDAASGACRLWGGQEDLPAGTTYRALAARYLWEQAPSRQRAAIRQAVRLETVVEQLEGRDEYTCTLDTPDGSRSKRLRWSWLDRENGVLLAVLRDL